MKHTNLIRKTLTAAAITAGLLTATITGLSAPAGAVVGAGGSKPTVSPLVPSVTSLSHSGGDVLLSTTVSMGDGSAMADGQCTIRANRPVDGLPVTFACSAGVVSHGVTIPPNTSTKGYPVKFREDVVAYAGGKTGKTPWTAPVMLDPFLGQASAIAAGAAHTCAITGLTGTVRCWGDNSNGQLGNKTFTKSLVPVTVKGLSGATAIAAGYWHTCALLSGGTVKCWGRNGSGQLGHLTPADSNVPVSVTGLTGAIAIAAGANHTCALLWLGGVQCWGYNHEGQLGRGNYANSNVPVSVTGLTGATTIAAGGFHTCALISGGTVKCWGHNDHGQLGNLGLWTNADSNVPMSVTGLTGVIAIAAGDVHTCALLSGGSVKCWGYNLDGELGDGNYADTNVPMSVTGLTGVIAIAAGANHTCALISDGTVQCWGYNAYGQLGDGTYNAGSNVPVSVSGMTGATATAAGGFHSCAVLSGGSVQCWGRNSLGQLGNGTNSHSNAPVSVTGL